jgi:hypothetical protein
MNKGRSLMARTIENSQVLATKFFGKTWFIADSKNQVFQKTWFFEIVWESFFWRILYRACH